MSVRPRQLASQILLLQVGVIAAIVLASAVITYQLVSRQVTDEYEKRSPLHYLPEVSTPMLVAHWEGDIRVPIGQGEELYTGLRMLGKEAQLVRYPAGFHILSTPSQAVDLTRRVLAWNQQHDGRRPRRRA